MTSPDRLRKVALWSLVGLVFAGCATKTDSSTDAQNSMSEPTNVSTSTTASDHDQPVTSTDRSAAPGPAATVGDDPQTPTVTVEGGDLPAELVDGYTRNGGDLVDPAEWRGRFGQSPLPEVTGSGVRLVEGLRRMELVDGHWNRTDEAGWLAMTADGRDSVLGILRSAAGIVGVASSATSTDQGADCVIDTYPPDSSGVSWQVQGCSYDKFPRLVSLGLSRTGPSDDPPAPVDPTAVTVAETVDGSVTFVEVRFGEPAPDGSTLRLSTNLESPGEFSAAATAVADGPLAGWQTFPGESSLLLSGPTGATWTLSEGVAVFTWSGRW